MMSKIVILYTGLFASYSNFFFLEDKKKVWKFEKNILFVD